MAVGARCYTCRTRVRSLSTHDSTARHRQAIRNQSGDTSGPVRSKGAEYAAGLRASGKGYDPGTPEQNESAAARLDPLYGSVIVENDPSAPDAAVGEWRDADLSRSAPYLASAVPAVLVAVPATRPTCERCGQVFRLHGTGYSWHVANRPDCARRLSVVA